MPEVINKVLLFAVISSLLYRTTMSGTVGVPASASHNAFAADLFGVVVDKKYTDNVVFSPASVQVSLALAFGGAEGHTAEEMRKVLKLPEDDKIQVLESYKVFLKNFFKSSPSTENAPLLKMANRLYVNSNLKIASQFNTIAQDYFNTQAENVDFNKNQEVVENINHWVEQQTENKIQNLLQPNAVNGQTSAVMVNAIYFKAKWLHPFSATSTSKAAFFMNNKQKIEVDTMFTDERFGYVELPELEATALEMPYKDSDISMLIILPNDKEGLEKLETKLKNWDLNQITTKMSVQDVEVFLPKFRIEYNIDLKEPLKHMGLNSMFDQTANFSGLFENAQHQRISDVKHKAFLDVNEAGSEAAAATYMKIVPMSLNLEQKVFRADHPFVFAIRNKYSVFFAGHVAKF